jgi:hypothetical protein
MMRVQPQNSDTTNTSSPGFFNKNESCKTIRIDWNWIYFAKKIPKLLVLVFQMPWHNSSICVECNFDPGYCVHPALKCNRYWMIVD